MQRKEVTNLVIMALKVLGSANIPRTFKNVVGVIVFRQQAAEEDIREQAQEALKFGVLYGVLRKEGDEFIMVDDANTANETGINEENPGVNSGDNADDKAKDSPQDIAENASENIAACNAEEISEHMTKDHAENASENIPAGNAVETVEHIADNLAEPIAEHIAENASENIAEYSTQHIEFEAFTMHDVNAFTRDLMQLLARYAKRTQDRRQRLQRPRTYHSRQVRRSRHRG